METYLFSIDVSAADAYFDQGSLLNLYLEIVATAARKALVAHDGLETRAIFDAHCGLTLIIVSRRSSEEINFFRARLLIPVEEAWHKVSLEIENRDV